MKNWILFIIIIYINIYNNSNNNYTWITNELNIEHEIFGIRIFTIYTIYDTYYNINIYTNRYEYDVYIWIWSMIYDYYYYYTANCSTWIRERKKWITEKQ